MSLETTPTHPDAVSYVSLSEADAAFLNRNDVSSWDALTDDQKEAVLKLATQQIDSFRFFGEQIYKNAKNYRLKQSLEWPRTLDKHFTGNVTSAGNNYIIDSNRADNENEPDDRWNDGVIIIIEGTGKGQIRKISDFEFATGKITVSTNWATNPDETSQYHLVEEIRDGIKNAIYEQSLFIIGGGRTKAQKKADGVSEYEIGDLREKFNDIISRDIPVSVESKAYLKGLIKKIGVLTR